MMKIFNTRKRSVLIPALAGGITGAGLALLVAPKTGKELRKDLKRLARKTQDQVSEAIDTGREFYGDGKEAVFNAVETGRKTFIQGKKKFDEITHRGGNSLVVPLLATGVIGAGFVWLLGTKSGKEIYHEGKAAVSGAMESGKKAFIEGTEKFRRAA